MCANSTLEEVESLVVVRGLTAAAGSSLTTAAVVYISVHQAFRTTLQRLVLALTVATAVNLLAMTMQIHVGSASYCVATGFLVQFTTSVAAVLVIGTVLYLWRVIQRAGRLQQPRPSSYTSHAMELGFYLSSVFLPLSLSCLPFLGHHYGRVGAWCWITGCTPTGLLYQSLLGYLPTTLTCILTTSLVAGISCRYCRWAHRFRLQRQVLLIEAAEVSLLLLYLLCYAVFSVFELAFGVIVRRKIVKEYWLHMTYAITRPLLLALVPLSLLLYLYSTRKAVQKMLAWCPCLRHPHSQQRGREPRAREEDKAPENKWLLRGSGRQSSVGDYSSSALAVTGINTLPSNMTVNGEEDDDPLYSTTDSQSSK